MNSTVPRSNVTLCLLGGHLPEHGWYHLRHAGMNVAEPRLSWPIQVDVNSRSVGVDLIFLLQEQPERYARIDWNFLNTALHELRTAQPRIQYGGPGSHTWNYCLVDLHSRVEVGAAVERVVCVLEELIARADGDL